MGARNTRTRPKGHENGSGDRKDHFWVLASFADGEERVLSVGDGETLLLFGFEEEARLYGLYGLGAREGRWQVIRKSRSGVSRLLFDPRCGARYVALDPVPELRGEPDATATEPVYREDFFEAFGGGCTL